MRLLRCIILGLLVAGCAYVAPYHAVSLEGSAAALAREVGAGLNESYRGVTVIVAAPVDAGTFHSGDFGLALQELLIAALARQKVNVVEVQLREVPYLNCSDGLVALSRDAARVRDEQRAAVIVVGTYVQQRGTVVLTARAVDFASGDVITASTVTLGRSGSIDDLLAAGAERRLYEN